MKKVGCILLIVIVAVIGYGIINEITFSPLKKKDLRLLFPDYNGKIRVSYHKDFIGWSRGDFFDLYIYNLDNVCIAPDYPQIGKDWEYVTLPDSLIITKWQRCPIDTFMLSKYDFELYMATTKEAKRETLKQDMKDVTNYYCCIYVNGLEKFFLLYSPSKSIMYYIRQRGF